MNREIANSFTIEDKKKAIEGLAPDKNITEEEFENFMQRVTEVGKIVKKLASDDVKEQQIGNIMANKMLAGNIEQSIIKVDDELLTTKSDRTVINKYSKDDHMDPNEMSKEAFMKSMEKDAKVRSDERKIRNERADTYKRIGNGAFGEADYHKAITYYGKAIEQRKDSAVIWNNRALCHMKLGLYERALHDCEWALKINDSNIKALLNSAKCYNYLGNTDKRDEFITLAKQRIPKFSKYIEDFENALKENPNDSIPHDDAII